MSPQSQAMFFTILPILLAGLALFVTVKWGGAKVWHVVIIVIACVVLFRSAAGPYIERGLSMIPPLH